MKTKSSALQPLIAELDNVIAAAQAAHLDETAALLRMARLDLVMRAHDIATHELELVSFALARGYAESTVSARAKSVPVRKKTRSVN
jgi:hypothetical protein